MRLHGIYAITDDDLLPGERLYPAVAAALNAGIALVQYRPGSGSGVGHLTRARRLQRLCARHHVPLIVNDEVALCRQAGAAGVHLGQDDMSPRRARAQLGKQAIIGVSCHDSLAAGHAAEEAGANYAAFGRFFPSKTKPEAPPANLHTLVLARAQLTIPVVAIGGISAENGAALVKAGAHMLAVIHALFGTSNAGDAAARLTQLFDLQAENQQRET